ncbi:UvrD-helicase domain-containing protein [Blattabacterium cuenoti]|uniref:UvrD-helicase domain-containing protein n=1 Tax=Blattabacterium cuenoti TaxID=1653831 RepID=UPI00163C0C89|nr:UvrD-helicase domain-containing protein [Blattabacterium cuenoti]
MLTPATLKIYNASAGSGKTFFLVKNYLYLLFKSTHNDEYKNILALTFTNKASEEMKKRILQCIKEFSNQKIKKEYYPLFNYIKENLNLSKDQISERSKKILCSIFSDYSSFSISTIDRFTYRTIRSFLPNFNLEMDTDMILCKITNNLLYRLNCSEKWSHTLIQISLNKFQEGRNWDLRKEILKIASLIIDENSFFSMKKIKNKSLNDWLILRNSLLIRTNRFEKKCKKQGKKFFKILKKTSIQKNSFPYLDLPKFFQKFKTGKLIMNPFIHNRIEKYIKTGILYKKKVDTNQKYLIQKNTLKILLLYKKIKYLYKKNIVSYILDKQFLNKLDLLSLIHEIEKDFKSLKEKKQILLNNELNQILYGKIVKESFPYIYEKMCLQYKHYFIDEFQDISFLQWENIRILVENVLSENGTTMIVGDPKQSIYSWRGGDAKSFLHLLYYSSDKHYNKEIVFMNTNFRSFEEIVNFNNSLYLETSKTLDNPYKNIYKKSQQKILKKSGGYVELNFLKIEKKKYNHYVYSKIKKVIEKLCSQKYKLSDIAILVRNNAEGSFLSEKLVEEGIKVNTSVSLLIKNHLVVKIIINFFYIIFQPLSYQKRANLILLLLNNNIIHTKEKYHDFLIKTIFLPIDAFFKKILRSKKTFNINDLSIYQIAEKIILKLELFSEKNTIYIYSFLDFIHRSMKIVGNSILDFLELWESKKKKESITIYDNIDAIQIMTIHKSKGLQFPVVILPFSDWNGNDISSKKKVETWINVSPRLYHGFDSLYLEIDTSIIKQHIKDHSVLLHFYKDYLSKIKFENINLLYVATTRPIEQLFIFSMYENIRSISFYLKNFLKKKKLWKDETFQYSFGISKKMN